MSKKITINRKYLTVLLLTILVPLVIVTPIGITNAVVSNNIEKELLKNRIEWDVEISCEIYNVNRTALCGCNFTDSILIVKVSFIEWDNHSDYDLLFNDLHVFDPYQVDVEPLHLNVYEIVLNTTSLTNGKEVYRHSVFDNWTRTYGVAFCENFRLMFKVICFWHYFGRVRQTSLATFSISNGFNWK